MIKPRLYQVVQIKLYRCLNDQCSVRENCKNFLLEDGTEGQVYEATNCNIYWPTDQLLGSSDDKEGINKLRPDKWVHGQFNPRTRRHRRKGGEWS